VRAGFCSWCKRSVFCMEAAGGDLDRQTTLPRGRGVCLISSSCPGPLTAATGSKLAGRRLQGCALRTVLSHRAPRGRQWPCGATPSIYGCHAEGSIWFSQLCVLIHDLSPCTARPPRGREEARSAGRWGSFEGWRKTTPPCEERGAAARRDEHFQQTMTGEFRAGHGRRRSHTGREDQADATTGGSVVCRWRVPGYGLSPWTAQNLPTKGLLKMVLRGGWGPSSPIVLP